MLVYDIGGRDGGNGGKARVVGPDAASPASEAVGLELCFGKGKASFLLSFFCLFFFF